MKNILISEDLSAWGQVSMATALPIFTVAGIRPALMPTALLSTHTGFPDNTYLDLSQQLGPILDHWKQLELNFDAVYLGYLGKQAIDFWLENANSVAKKQLLLDPAMADHGKLYRGFDQAYVEKMKSLASLADILLPNLTEARLLLDQDLSQAESMEEATDLIEELVSKFSLKQAVITGIELNKQEIGMVIYDQEITQLKVKRIDRAYFGTGDLFASALLATLSNERDFLSASQIASQFILRAIESTKKQDPRLGPDCSQALSWLIDELKGKCVK